MRIVGGVLIFLLYGFLLLLIGRLIFDYLRIFARSWNPRGILLVVAETTYTATDPPLNFLRRFIPPLRFGTVALDLSYALLFIMVFVMINVVSRLMG